MFIAANTRWPATASSVFESEQYFEMVFLEIVFLEMVFLEIVRGSQIWLHLLQSCICLKLKQWKYFYD